MKKVALLTSGGDSQGMNSFLACFLERVEKYDIEAYAILEGYTGLLEKKILPLKEVVNVNDFTIGGSVIKTSRNEEMKTIEGQKKAARNVKEMDIDVLVVIGGNGSIAGARALAKLGVNVIGVPATIDNDLMWSENSLGYTTAINNAVESIDKIMDSMRACDRGAVIEVMGRNCGNIALAAGIGARADVIITKEGGVDLAACDKIAGKDSPLVVIAENILDKEKLADDLSKKYEKRVVPVSLGYVQRGGEPIASDKILAVKLVVKTLELLEKNISNKIIGERNARVLAFDFQEIDRCKDNFDYELSEMMKK